MLEKTLIVLSLVLIAKSTQNDEEATVETVDDYYSNDILKEEILNNARRDFEMGNANGRYERSNIDNPLVDLITRIIGNGLPSKSSNFFAFLQDQYNLPGGKQQI